MITLIFAFIAGLSNGVMDFVYFRWNEAPEWMKKRKWFWNPSLSWKNKYKDIDGDGLGDVSGGAKFFLSITWLVAFSDAWHTFKMIMKFSFALAAVFYTSLYFENIWLRIILDTLLIWSAFQIGFTFTFKVSGYLIKKR